MLRDVSQLDMRVELFGEWVEFPVCVASVLYRAHKLLQRHIYIQLYSQQLWKMYYNRLQCEKFHTEDSCKKYLKPCLNVNCKH